MGKKIEKISGKDFCNPNGQYACSPSMHDIGRLQVKINEIIEWIEEQEKIGDEELTFVRETLPQKRVENNTEEWKEELSELLLRYIDRDKDEKDIVNFIKQLLEEDRRRSFNDLIKKLTDSDY